MLILFVFKKNTKNNKKNQNLYKKKKLRDQVWNLTIFLPINISLYNTHKGVILQNWGCLCLAEWLSNFAIEIIAVCQLGQHRMSLLSWMTFQLHSKPEPQ